jgi:circadian clock protein KaiB
MPKIPKARRTGSKKNYVLKLYVAGANRRSQRAVANLTSVVDRYLSGSVDLEVVDVYRSIPSAEEAGILATPTLVKKHPLPAGRLVGDLSETNQVLILLDVKAKNETNAQNPEISTREQ